MKTDHTEIRRLATGSIDTDHYIRHCHRERSIAAHRAIGRTFNMPRELIEAVIRRWNERGQLRKTPEPAE